MRGFLIASNSVLLFIVIALAVYARWLRRGLESSLANKWSERAERVIQTAKEDFLRGAEERYARRVQAWAEELDRMRLELSGIRMEMAARAAGDEAP
jgi:uncharacterized damage-inducible protein DinB